MASEVTAALMSVIHQIRVREDVARMTGNAELWGQLHEYRYELTRFLEDFIDEVD
jgi:hypothetical protein